MRQKVVLYKTGKFLQASVAEVAFETKKLTVQILHERPLNQAKGTET